MNRPGLPLRTTGPRWPAALVLVLFLFWPSGAGATTLSLPLVLDYALLRALFVQQMYTDPGQVAVVLNENNGCQVLELSDPSFAGENGLVRFGSRLRIKAGVMIGGTCRGTVTFNGSIEVVKKAVVNMPGWRLALQTVESRLLDERGKPARLPKILWSLVQKVLHPYLDGMQIELLPSVEQIQALLPLFVSAAHQQRIGTWLQGMRPGDVATTAEAIRLPILIDAPGLEDTRQPAPPEKALLPEELARFVTNWQDWDAFLVAGIRRLSILGLDPDASRLLLDILLDTRYRFIAALTADTPVGAPDLVRRQFMTVWQQIAPLARANLTATPSPWLLSYLAFFSAGDALAVLDRLGPALDLEISRDGLIRMARLIADDSQAIDLDYSYAVDPLLRFTLGFGPALDESGPAFSGETLDLDPSPAQPEAGFWHRLLPGRAFAATQAPDITALKAWIVDEANFSVYLPRVRGLLEEQAEAALAAGGPDNFGHDLFITLIKATAWQESCLRQFVADRGKLSFLRSWNNTSVGLMQVNERIWRGLYRVESLRWNPAYNVRAGAEIMHTYLTRYVLKDAAPGNADTLARAAYALYNGGPGQLKAFYDRRARNAYLKSDNLFWEKYKLAKAGAFDQVSVCLFGNTISNE